MSTEALAASEVVNKMQSHLEDCNPGMPAAFTEACVTNDAIWQGDLCLKIVHHPGAAHSLESAIPDNYKKVESPKDEDRQLVPEGGEGSRHKLQSLKGVEIYRPDGWGVDEEMLSGPIFVLSSPGVVEHPKHGNVTIPAGFAVRCSYQREYDEEQKRERRARD
ncbi:MAG: hypothetical protein CMK32_08205 [Porticoccaceae bacterium]|nr:hypothetical protein [Porticoccaceae bacterium]